MTDYYIIYNITPSVNDNLTISANYRFDGFEKCKYKISIFDVTYIQMNVFPPGLLPDRCSLVRP